MDAPKRKIKFDPPTMALVSKVACPHCGTSTLVPFSVTSLEGTLVCLNPVCQARYPVTLMPDISQKAAVEKMLRTGQQVVAESRAVDWSTASAVLGAAEEPPLRPRTAH